MFPYEAILPVIWDGARTNVSLYFAIIASVLAWVLMRHHFQGYQLQVGGMAPRAATYAGFDKKRAVWISLAIGGFRGRAGGRVRGGGAHGQLQRSVSSGYGYAAIIVAYVGGLNPIGIVASAFLISVVYIGGDAATVSAGLPWRRPRCFRVCCWSIIWSA